MLYSNFEYWNIFILLFYERIQESLGKEINCESEENDCLSKGLKEKKKAALIVCIDQVSWYFIFSLFFL